MVIPPASGDASHEIILTSVKEFVKEYMSHYDASHDYAHIQRVLALALRILALERAGTCATTRYDDTLITLGALLHDVGDKKYLLPGQDATTLVRDTLLARNASPSLADTVQRLVLHVSFSTETKNPAAVREVLRDIPELAVVQDADRLDALGAVGIARCFTFGGAKGGGGGLDGAVAHFGEKLELLEGMMKTEAGRALARERTERLRVFRGWWESENQGLS